ncbi:hypothetical protein D3C85_1572620 [compost metagenome]
MLLPWATELEAVNETFKAILTPEKIEAVIALIPDNWLEGETNFSNTNDHRKAYAHFLTTRLSHADTIIKEAQYAREVLI